MKKQIALIFIITNFFISICQAQPIIEKQLATEINIGTRIPIGITKNDISTGLAINAGIGYRLNKYFEILHLGIDFGNSSPKDPDMTVVSDYYSGYGSLAMEMVTVIGFPITSRIHFPLKDNFEGFVGGGFSYYWYNSKFEAPSYYGNYSYQLRAPRKRNGYGPVIEGGLITNFFSDRWLIMLLVNMAIVDTHGKSLSVQKNIDPEMKYNRTDKYLTIALGVHYLIEKNRFSFRF
jgi:hypothetical protein